MKTIEQIALEALPDSRLKEHLWFKGTLPIEKEVTIDFAQKFLAAWLAQQEPVAWVSGHLRYAFERAERYVPIAVEVSLVNMGWKNQIPLFLAPPPSVQEWRPIETAPKDGTYIFAAEETDPGFWEYERIKWTECNGFSGGVNLCNPTHWMPLPPAPKGEQE